MTLILTLFIYHLIPTMGSKQFPVPVPQWWNKVFGTKSFWYLETYLRYGNVEKLKKKFQFHFRYLDTLFPALDTGEQSLWNKPFGTFSARTATDLISNPHHRT